MIAVNKTKAIVAVFGIALSIISFQSNAYESNSSTKSAISKCHNEWGTGKHADGCNIGVSLYVFSRMVGDSRRDSLSWCQTVCGRHPNSASRFSQASCKTGCNDAYRTE